MISTCLKRNSLKALLCVVFASGLCIPHAFAQQASGLSLSVTPTLFQMSAEPLQAWESSIRVINNNAHELTVYASVVNFAPQGETGQGKLVPVLEESTEGTTLAEWITISNEPIVIAQENSATVPFTVQVPEDAAPGGHFAAILIGTRPIDSDKGFQVKTSQIVTSLFFVRIAGDVVEEGTIREFRTLETFADKPQANFELRFENEGNVHLQPQGEIVITNMWGKERGIIPINHETHFGNVLPQSIRKFEFAWNGEPSLTDIGRYKAVVTLAYGEAARNFESRTAYFYVVPVKPLIIVLGSLIAFVFFVSWCIKLYVRRMLLLAGVEPVSAAHAPRSFKKEGDVRIVKRASVKAPVQKGVLDLKDRLKQTSALIDKIKTLGGFIASYKFFFGAVFIFCIALVGAYLFFAEVFTEQKDYEVVIDNADVDVKLSSEDILYEKQSTEDAQLQSTAQIIASEEQSFELILVNSSDTPGAAARLQSELEAQGYTVDDLQSDFSESKDRTVIVYSVSLQEEALLLSRMLSNALLSADPNSETNAQITVYIGNDYSLE